MQALHLNLYVEGGTGFYRARPMLRPIFHYGDDGIAVTTPEISERHGIEQQFYGSRQAHLCP